jgi:hypothetical protein
MVILAWAQLPCLSPVSDRFRGDRSLELRPLNSSSAASNRQPLVDPTGRRYQPDAAERLCARIPASSVPKMCHIIRAKQESAELALAFPHGPG